MRKWIIGNKCGTQEDANANLKKKKQCRWGNGWTQINAEHRRMRMRIYKPEQIKKWLNENKCGTWEDKNANLKTGPDFSLERNSFADEVLASDFYLQLCKIGAKLKSSDREAIAWNSKVEICFLLLLFGSYFLLTKPCI